MIWGAAATSVAQPPRPRASIVTTATYSFAFMAVPPCAGLCRRGAVKESYRDAHLATRIGTKASKSPAPTVNSIIDHFPDSSRMNGTLPLPPDLANDAGARPYAVLNY